MTQKLELAGAISLFLIVVAGWYLSSDYPVGTVTAMGPGFVPRLLMVVLGGLSIAIMVRARRVSRPAEPFHPRPLIAVMAAIGLFAALVGTLGLMPATFALACAASLAEGPARPVATAVLGLSLCAMAYLIFIVGLGMPVRLFWF
jgi:hypothetical protein